MCTSEESTYRINYVFNESSEVVIPDAFMEEMIRCGGS